MLGPCYDAFVIKLDPTGTKILYATYLGGSGDDSASSIAVGAAGDVFIAGRTFSADFPVTPMPCSGSLPAQRKTNHSAAETLLLPNWIPMVRSITPLILAEAMRTPCWP